MIVLTVVGVLVALNLVGALITAQMILRPSRRSLAQAADYYGNATPADFRRAYAEMQVFVGEETIHGWLVRAEPPSARAVVLIHGLGDNRVGMLSFLPILEPLGVNVALIDLRAHGESGGRHLTYGVREREDVKAVIDWLIERRLAEPGGVALVGLSLGGSVAIQAAANDERVAAVVTDGAFAWLRPLIYRRATQVFPPAVLSTPLAIAVAEQRAGFSVAKASPASLAGRVRCPVLLIHGAADWVVPPEHALALKEALGSRADLWMLPEVGHGAAFSADEVVYTRRVRRFLEAHVARGAPAASRPASETLPVPS